MHTRPTFLAAALFCLALLCAWAMPVRAQNASGLLPSSAAEAEKAGPDDAYFEELRNSIFETGLGRNNIPPINRPQYISVQDAALAMDDGESVFVLDYGNPDGQPRIYPRRVLVWHVVVNEVLGSGKNARRRSITYSPITGCVRGYSGEVAGFSTPFGSMGTLLNANSILFDYSTNSMWSQLLGMAFDGPLKGTTLESFPLVWTTWGRARKRYPDAKVLSRATGYRRSYGTDPYGSYRRDDSYYQDQRILHPLLHQDDRLEPKARVLGLHLDDLSVAIVRQSLKQPKAANFDAGVTPIVSLWDEDLDAPRLFDRRVGNYQLHFVYRDGSYFDVETGTRWQPDGLAVEGRLENNRLALIDGFDVMWFAWSAFYPSTTIFSWEDAVTAQKTEEETFSAVEQVEPPEPTFDKPGTETLPTLPNVTPPALPKDIPPTVITPDMKINPEEGL
ncbi:DUF3179 domain-containing protein [Oceanidesulfovibrio marinus]|nr:DUF3179 domain-containing protein [Oceanidesulfovibrio marinus]